MLFLSSRWSQTTCSVQVTWTSVKMPAAGTVEDRWWWITEGPGFWQELSAGGKNVPLRGSMEFTPDLGTSWTGSETPWRGRTSMGPAARTEKTLHHPEPEHKQTWSQNRWVALHSNMETLIHGSGGRIRWCPHHQGRGRIHWIFWQHQSCYNFLCHSQKHIWLTVLSWSVYFLFITLFSMSHISLVLFCYRSVLHYNNLFCWSLQY